jgi:hypothetical protein
MVKKTENGSLGTIMARSRRKVIIWMASIPGNGLTGMSGAGNQKWHITAAKKMTATLPGSKMSKRNLLSTGRMEKSKGSGCGGIKMAF